MTAGDVTQTGEGGAGQEEGSQPLNLREIFVVFFKSGMAFGGGVGILSLLQREVVEKRPAISRADLLEIYGLARVVPSGAMSATAVGLGYRWRGLLGTLTALVAMILPSFVLTVLLTVAYVALRGSPIFDVLNVTLMPAALAIIIVAALRLGQEFLHPSIELALAVAGFLGVVLFGWSAPLLLLAGGIISACTTWEKVRARTRRA